MTAPLAMVLQAVGTNRDGDVAEALSLAGAAVLRVPMARLLRDPSALQQAQLLVLPGGFSHGDDLGAGRLWALELRAGLFDALQAFVASGRPVLGICNGFQALVKAGLLPGPDAPGAAFAPQRASLACNAEDSDAGGRFLCRWVTVEADTRCRSPWLAGWAEGRARLHCPIAHGEGRFVADEATLDALEQSGRLALRYVAGDGPSDRPHNPNGSARDVAGVCNAAGNVLGLMPHPEDHIRPGQTPPRGAASRGRPTLLGLPLFEAGVRLARQT